MHANDPSIWLAVFILETMLITFRFSYKLANKLEALGISSLHSHHNLCPKVGKSNTYRILTWYFGSGETAVGSFTGLKLSKRWFCQNHIQEREKNEFRIISYLIFPLRTHPKTVFMSRSRPNPTTASLSCTRSGRTIRRRIWFSAIDQTYLDFDHGRRLQVRNSYSLVSLPTKGQPN